MCRTFEGTHSGRASREKGWPLCGQSLLPKAEEERLVMSPIPASSVAAGALSPVGNASRVEGWPFVDNPYSPGRRRKGWRYRQSLPLLPIGWSPHCRLPRRYGHPPAAQVSASHLWSLMQWRLLLRSGLNLLTRRRLRCLWWPGGEKHQRAWEAELLAFSETMTLV